VEDEEEDAAAKYNQGILDELGDALAAPAAVSGGLAGAAKSQAAGPLPEQQGQLVAVVQAPGPGCGARDEEARQIWRRADPKAAGKTEEDVRRRSP